MPRFMNEEVCRRKSLFEVFSLVDLFWQYGNFSFICRTISHFIWIQLMKGRKDKDAVHRKKNMSKDVKSAG